jgi:integrase
MLARARERARSDLRKRESDEVRRMLSLVRGDRLEAPVVLGLMGGLRIGEVCGLPWGDLDLDRGPSFAARGTVR